MNTNDVKKKVIVGMSGGVDSSVAALLLKQQGYEVEGLFMKNWEEDDTDTYCAAAEDLEDVKSVCTKLDIKLHTANFSAEYWDKVFAYFLEEYQAGRTPNPDILCNKEIKFKAALDYVETLNGNYFATGHYAGIKFCNINKVFTLEKAKDLNKDQTYFLYTLGQKQLKNVLFPLANLTKPEIRQIAKDNNLITHNKKDSTGICFIGERKFKDFLQKFIPAKPGNIVTVTGEIIGKHDGLMFYTLGQRQGLGIGGTKNTTNAPWYVVEKDLKHNNLIVAQGENHPSLYSNQLLAENLHWVAGNQPESSFHCKAKIRYRQEERECLVTIENKHAIVTFTEKQKAITPGQSIVFYNDNICLGGGIITNSYSASI